MSEKIFNTDDVDDLLSLARRRKSRLEKEKPDEGRSRTEESGEIESDFFEEELGPVSTDFRRRRPVREEINKEPENARKRMRITMLGISGSGKTSFLSGVYQTLISGSYHGLSLVSAADSRRAFQQIGQIADIALIRREGYQFAPGTQETTVFPLRLINRGKTVCDFDFTDYAGGSVDVIMAGDGHLTPEAEELKEQLQKSDAFLIFADATLLCEKEKYQDWQQAVGAPIINPLFKTLVQFMDEERPLTVLFVLTKTDDERIPLWMKENHFAELVGRILRAFDGIYEMAKYCAMDQGWSVGVVPVSAVGEGNSSLRVIKNQDGKTVQQGCVKEGCAPEPYNIEAAMIYTIACVLSQWHREYGREREKLESKLIEAGRGNTGFGNLFARMQRKWTKGDKDAIQIPQEVVGGLLQDIEGKIQEIDVLNDKILDLIEKEGILDVIQRQCHHLEET